MQYTEESVETWFSEQCEKAFEDYTLKVKKYGNKPEIIVQYKKRLGGIRDEYSKMMDKAIKIQAAQIRVQKMARVKSPVIVKKKVEK